MNKETFQKYFFGMCEVKGQSVSEFVADSYWNGLKHLTDDQFIKAINWAINEYEFPKIPQIAQLKKMFEVNENQIAEQEAYKVFYEIRRVGYYGQPVFDNPVTAEVVRNFGWQKICATLLDDKKNWFVKEFASLYEITAKNPPQIGRAEARNFLTDLKRRIENEKEEKSGI